jgi:molybdopterin synthase sulfur carrier subunit
VKIKYFAWMRQKAGVAEEEVTPPDDVRTVQDLIDWLAGRSPKHAEAFSEAKVFGAAIDQQVVKLDAPVAGAREVAFFPPFTGG